MGTSLNPIEAEQVCLCTIQALKHGTGTLDQFPVLLRRVIKERLWERRQVPGKGIVELKNLRELITSKPKVGWGEDPAKIEAIIRDDPEVLVLWREAMKGQEGGDTTGNNVTSAERVTGNSRAYTLTRLQREAPELFAEVKAGKMSAHRAAIRAGIRREPSSYELAQRAVKRLTDQERRRLFQEFEG